MLDTPRSEAKRFVPLDRLSLMTSLALVGLTLSLVLDLPSRLVDFSIFGSEAGFTVSGVWLIAFVLAALTAAGVNGVARAHPRIHLGETRYLFILWILPALIVVAATTVLSATNVRVNGAYALTGIAITGVFLTVVVLGEYVTIDLSDRWYSIARLGVNTAVYLAALIFFVTIYSWKIRTLYSAPAIGMVAGLLALELLRGSESDFRRTWLFGAVVGLSLAEIVWALNYMNLPGFMGGALLLVFFYAMTGLLQQYLWDRLNRIVFTEFAMIVIGAIALLFWLRPG